MPRRIDRRQLLLGLAALIAGTPGGAPLAADEPAALLAARPSTGDCSQVEIDVEIGGDLYPAAAGVAPTANTGTKLPIQINARLRYGQRLVEAEPTATGARRALRDLTLSEASIGIGSSAKKNTVREDRRLLVAESHGDGAIYSPRGLLTRDELDLLDLPADPLYADGLLPAVAVAEGDSWNIPAEALAPLVGVDSTNLVEASAVVTELLPAHAKFRFAGVVHGMDEGAETKIDVRGVAMFDRKQGRVTQLNLAFREERAAGPATPAIDTNAKINVRMTPVEAIESLADAKAPAGEARPQDLLLELEGPDGAWSTQHDRAWLVTSVDRTSVTLRRVTGVGATGQMTIALQPAVRADRTPTLAKLEREVRYSLGQNFDRVVGSNQWTTKSGLACLALVSRGAMEGTAVEWRHYQAFPPLGGRVVSVATTIDESLAETLGDADRAIVEALEVAAVPATVGARGATVR